MTSDAPLLAAGDLTVDFGGSRAVDGVSFQLEEGEVLAVVGESGSGKSTLARAIIGTLPRTATIPVGAVNFRGRDLLAMDADERRGVRGRSIGFVPQDPLAALNPVHRVGAQVAEALRAHRRLSRRDAWSEAVALLDRVGISDAARRARDYPHRLSGGERQRVVIAMAISVEPSVIVADEPTTALDATVQAEIVELLDELRRTSNLALVLVSHDLGVVAAMADSVLVLYAGRVAEYAPAEVLYSAPTHPYTQALLASVPRLGHERRVRSIPGSPPSLRDLPSGCALHPRCPFSDEQCQREIPIGRELRPGHLVACHHPRGVDG